MEELRSLARRVLALLAEESASLYTLSLTKGETRELNTELENFSLYRTVFSHSLNLTVLNGTRRGSASGNDLSEEGIRRVVREAVDNAASSPEDPANAIAENEGEDRFLCGTLEPDMDSLYRRIREFMDGVGREYPRVRLLQIVGSHTRSCSLYLNSSGTRFETRRGSYLVTMEFSAAEGENRTGLDSLAFTTQDMDRPFLEQKWVRQHMEDVQKSLCPLALRDKFEGTVVFTPDCLGSMLSMLMDNYLASHVIIDGTSQWLNRIGEKVADERISLSLPPEDPRLAMAYPVSADGYRCEHVRLLDRGVLRSHVLSLYAARKTGRSVTRTAGRNLVMEKGDTPLADIIASIDHGLVVGGFSGGHPGPSGEFSGVAKNSFLIEKGRITGAVTETMINGNLEQLFRRVRAVSAEQVCDGECVLPYLACDGVVISGK